MPKDIQFKIRFSLDGTEHILDASANVKGLADALGIAKDKNDILAESLRKTVDRTRSFQQLYASIQSLTGLMQEYTAATAVQTQAETQLTTVMRQRMNATDEEIQAVKDLASEQQSLGVIGDEVQLAGAQQVATFLREKSSLDVLIPAMNNLIAQQRGLSATSQDAISVGNMMGKVLQGQTSALRRVGITFTEAQENALKYGNESERAATLAQVITDNVGDMNAALAQTDAGRAQQAANAFGDLKERLGSVFSSIEPAIIKFGQLGLAISALGTAVSSISGVTKALQSLSIASAVASAKTKLMKVGMLAYGAATGKTTAIQRLANIAMYDSARAATAAKIAMIGLKGVIGGLVLAGVVYGLYRLVKALRGTTEAAEQTEEAMGAYRRAAAEAKSEIDSDISKLDELIQSKGDEKAAVEEMNRKYGDSFGTYSTAAQWYDTLTQKSGVYCQMLAHEALAMKYRDQYADALDAKQAAADKMESMPDSVRQIGQAGAGMYSYTTNAEIPKEQSNAWKEAKKAYDEASAAEADLSAKMDAEVKKVAELAAELKNGAGSVTDDTDATGDSAKNLASALEKYALSVERAVEVNRAFGEGGDETTARLKAMRSGIISLINTYGTEDERIRTLISDYWALSRAWSEAQGRLPEGPVISSEFAATEGAGPVGQGDKETEQTVDNMSQIQDAIGAVSSAFSSLSSSIKGNASQWMSWIGSVLGAVGRAIPAILQLTAASELQAQAQQKAAVTGAAASVAATPVVGAALAASAVATVLAAILSAPKLASGGLASGPTLAMIGEYPGAAANPEVVAPLSDLKKMIVPQGIGGGDVTFRIEGRTLVGILNKESRYRSRIGG